MFYVKLQLTVCKVGKENVGKMWQNLEVTRTVYKSLEDFATTEFNEMYFGSQPCQDVTVFRCFGHSPHLGDGVCP